MKINVFWKKTDKIALALSGGVDSIVLFHLLINEYRDSYSELVVFHINHGLREQSDEEEQFIKQLTKQNKVKCYTKKLFLKNVKRKSHISEEMLARKLRYETFEKFAEIEKLTTILTAHHKNDCVENILMRILSGRGIDYNLSIENLANINNLLICRPLLNIEKKDLELYAKNNNLKYYEDETNFNTEYTRNYIRQKISPLIKGVNEKANDNLIEFANYYKELNGFAKNSTLSKIEKLNLKVMENKITLDYNLFLELNNLEKYFILSHLLNEYLTIFDFSKNSLTAIIADLDEFAKNVSYDIKADVKIIKEYETLTICKIEKKCYNDKIEISENDLTETFFCNFNDYKIEITNSKDNAELGFFKDDLPLLITTKKNGDVIKRGDITKKLARVFIDEKIPKSQRLLLPVIKNNKNEIIGVLGINSKVKQNKDYHYYIKLLKG